MRTCSTCRKTLELSEFNKRTNAPDGMSGRCKSCLAIARKRHPRKFDREKALARQSKYYAEKRAKKKAERPAITALCVVCGNGFVLTRAGRMYCGDACIQSSQSGGRHWLKVASEQKVLEYRERARVEYARRYAADPDKERKRTSIYKHANPEKAEKWGGKRVAIAKAQNDGTITGEAVRDLIERAKRCVYCYCQMPKRERTLDHMVPLSRGGQHSMVNVVICCRSCNSRKHARPYSEWVERLDEPGRKRAERLFRKRYGASPEQQGFGFQF